MLYDATFWTTVALVMFFAVLIYYGVPGMITSALDKRANDIRNELDEAKKLREEAAEILADYQRKRLEAESEAEDIVKQAKLEAAALAEETRVKLDEGLKRRTQQAEDKIAQAEAQAVADVRAKAVDVAVQAAEHAIGEKLDGSAASSMIDKAISDVTAKLN